MTLFKLAVVQEKQLSMERLFSLDSIYLPHSEHRRTILSRYSFSCIQVERMLYMSEVCKEQVILRLVPYLLYYASNASDKSCKKIRISLTLLESSAVVPHVRWPRELTHANRQNTSKMTMKDDKRY